MALGEPPEARAGKSKNIWVQGAVVEWAKVPEIFFIKIFSLDHNQMVVFVHGVKVSNETVIKTNTVKTKTMEKKARDLGDSRE